MAVYTKPRGRLYESSDGYSVEILTRSLIKYREGPRALTVSSETLLPPAGLAVYTSTILRWDPPHDAEPISGDERRRVVDNIVAALGSQGIPVDLF